MRDADCTYIAKFREGQRLVHPKGNRARLIILEDVKGAPVTIGVGHSG